MRNIRQVPFESAGWQAHSALGEQLKGNKMASRLAPPIKDENIDKRGGRS